MDALSKKDRQALQRSIRFIEHFQVMMGPTVSASMIKAFLSVALEEGKPLSDYAAACGVNLSTTSRHFMDLSDRSRSKGEGHMLIQRQRNPTNEREVLMSLSGQGKLMRRLVLETMGC
jgi:DNA-binding MarR family transcriptional regulator